MKKQTVLSFLLSLCVGCTSVAPQPDADSVIDAAVMTPRDAAHHVDLAAVDLTQEPVDMLTSRADMTGVYTIICPSFFDNCCDDILLKKEALHDTCGALLLWPTIVSYGQRCHVSGYDGWVSATYTCDMY